MKRKRKMERVRENRSVCGVYGQVREWHRKYI